MGEFLFEALVFLGSLWLERDVPLRIPVMLRAGLYTLALALVLLVLVLLASSPA